MMKKSTEIWYRKAFRTHDFYETFSEVFHALPLPSIMTLFEVLNLDDSFRTLYKIQVQKSNLKKFLSVNTNIRIYNEIAKEEEQNITELAKKLKISYKTVNQRINEMISWGFLEREQVTDAKGIQHIISIANEQFNPEEQEYLLQEEFDEKLALMGEVFQQAINNIEQIRKAIEYTKQ